MSSREIESLYWRISLIFILFSPLCIYHLSHIKINFIFNYYNFLIIILLTIPIQLFLVSILVVLRGGNVFKKFWIVEPYAISQNTVESDSLRRSIDKVSNLLKDLGLTFEINKSENHYVAISFYKKKDEQVHTFLGHAFSGTIDFMSQSNSVVQIESSVILHDTLIVDTGELAQIKELSDSLCLKVIRKSQKDFSLSLGCGLTSAFATVIVIILDVFLPITIERWLFALSTHAIGTILLTLIELQKKPSGSFRYRVVYSGLYLASIPYLCWIQNLIL